MKDFYELVIGLGFHATSHIDKRLLSSWRREGHANGGDNAPHLQSWEDVNDALEAGLLVRLQPPEGYVIVDDDHAATVVPVDRQREAFAVVQSPGGWHYYYRCPEGMYGATGKDNTKYGKGVDTRGHGGNVVGPGSVLKDHEIKDDHQTDEYSLVSCTEPRACSRGLMREIGEGKASREYTATAIPGELKAAFMAAGDGDPDAFPPGGRNDALYRRLLNADDLLAVLCDYRASKRSDGKWDRHSEHEMWSTVASALSSEARQSKERDEKLKDRIEELRDRPELPSFMRRAEDVVIEEKVWLIEPYLGFDAINVIMGPPNMGKSTTMLDWAGWLNAEGHNVFIVSTEMTAGEMEPVRRRSFQRRGGGAGRTIYGWDFAADVPLRLPDDLFMDALVNALVVNEVDVLMLEPADDCFNDGDPETVKEFWARLNVIRRCRGDRAITPVFNAHTTKNPSKELTDILAALKGANKVGAAPSVVTVQLRKGATTFLAPVKHRSLRADGNRVDRVVGSYTGSVFAVDEYVQEHQPDGAGPFLLDFWRSTKAAKDLQDELDEIIALLVREHGDVTVKMVRAKVVETGVAEKVHHETVRRRLDAMLKKVPGSEPATWRKG